MIAIEVRCPYCRDPHLWTPSAAAEHCVLCNDNVVCRSCVLPWKLSYSRTCKDVPPTMDLDQGKWLCLLCVWERKYSIELPKKDLTDTVRMQLRKLEDTYKVTMRRLYREEQARLGIANAEPGGEEENDGVARWMAAARKAVRPLGFEGGGIAK